MRIQTLETYFNLKYKEVSLPPDWDGMGRGEKEIMRGANN